MYRGFESLPIRWFSEGLLVGCVEKLVDSQDLKSCALTACGFDSRRSYF